MYNAKPLACHDSRARVLKDCVGYEVSDAVDRSKHAFGPEDDVKIFVTSVYFAIVASDDGLVAILKTSD